MGNYQIDESLVSRVNSVLTLQGFGLNKDRFNLLGASSLTREQKRDIHSIAKLERLSKNKNFLLEHTEMVKKYMIDGNKINVEKIQPKLRLVESGSEDEAIFRWWNLAWWSLPYERAYGRQMRFIVWDEFHNAPMGLIGLQSPILNWKARDSYLGIDKEDRDYWVNQSMSAQRLGALPPYNFLLGGKLIGSMMTTDTVRNAFEDKYKNKRTLIKDRILPSRLLFLTTTGAFGKSSVYDRLKLDGVNVAEFIGMTQGSGTFHIPNDLYQELVGYLASQGIDTKRGYGGGPSKKLRLITQALNLLGIKRGGEHGVQRAVYLFPLANNLNQVISKNDSPEWYSRDEHEVAEYWKRRWALPRATRDKTYRYFKSQQVIDDMLVELGHKE